jgi:CheY-like chemotaxis protein
LQPRTGPGIMAYMPTATAILRLKRGAIVVVDDNDILLSTLSRLLHTAFPHNPVVALPGGPACLEWMLSNHPSLLITDLVMPEVDGTRVMFECVQRYPDCGIIVISGYEVLVDVRKQVEHHSNIVCLSKPFDNRVLLDRAKYFLTRKSISRLSGMDVLSILQMLALDTKSGTLEIRQGSSTCTLIMDKGQIRFAKCAESIGYDALADTLEWPAPEFEFFNERTTYLPNVHESSGQLLLKLCHHLDMRRQARATGQIPEQTY